MALLILSLVMVLATCVTGLVTSPVRRRRRRPRRRSTRRPASAGPVVEGTIIDLPNTTPPAGDPPAGDRPAADNPPGQFRSDRARSGRPPGSPHPAGTGFIPFRERDQRVRWGEAEAALVAHLMGGTLSAEAYRSAMATLARQDDAVNPLVVPPDRPGDQAA